ncbi:hypothetical protein BH18ACT11_BH18ACT11_28690 [soil metagenome]
MEGLVKQRTDAPVFVGVDTHSGAHVAETPFSQARIEDVEWCAAESTQERRSKVNRA